MDNGFTLANISTRSLMAELLRRDAVTMLRGVVLEGDYRNNWVIKYEGPSADHPLGCYLVGASRGFGLFELTTTDEALDKLFEILRNAEKEEDT